jgi:hypothetical protein
MAFLSPHHDRHDRISVASERARVPAQIVAVFSTSNTYLSKLTVAPAPRRVHDEMQPDGN